MLGKTLTFAALFAIAFGLLTVLSGGLALFDGVDMGAVVPFVLWFNFAAGFAYVAAGVGLWRGAGWATVLSLLIAVASAVVFAALLWHVRQGGLYEVRTMAAMAFRLLAWIGISLLAILHMAGRRRARHGAS